jgi:hypothetical protein
VSIDTVEEAVLTATPRKLTWIVVDSDPSEAVAMMSKSPARVELTEIGYEPSARILGSGSLRSISGEPSERLNTTDRLEFGHPVPIGIREHG